MLCKPKPYYDEQNKVTIGYKNPLCLTRAQQVQPALYNDHEIIKTNHVPAIVHNSEDTLEIAKITRKKMNDKMKDLECVKKKVKIAPHNYSKENYLATFTPQKQLTPEQMFWSNDLIKMKAEALKEQTAASRPIKALTVFTEMHDAHTSLKARCLELEVELSNLRDKIQKDNHDESIKWFSNFEQNELFRAENGKIKQHYKELYNSIKITRAKHLEQTTALLTKNESLKVQIQNKLSCVNKDHVKHKVLAPGKYAIDVEPIPPCNRNNREVHLVYLKHLKESVETLREIVKEAKVERPLDSSLASACRYTIHSQELLEYVIGTCRKALNTRDNKHASTSLPKKKQVTFEEQCAMSKSNTHKHVVQLNCQKTNVPVPPSTGVNSCTDAGGSQTRSNTKKNRILLAKSVNMKKVEEHPRTIKCSLKTTNRVDSSISSKHTIINSNSHFVCRTCNKCLISTNHDMCVVTYLHFVNASPSVKNVVRKVKQVWKPKQVKQVWKPTGNILTTVGRTDRPLVFGLRLFKTYDRGSLAAQEFCKKVHRDGYTMWKDSWTDWGIICFCGHFVIGFWKLPSESMLVIEMMKSSPICLLSKASKHKSWLWHRRSNHLNFGTINDLARKDLVKGLPRLKFEKDHLFSACQLGKSKKYTHKLETENTNLEVLNTLHMDFMWEPHACVQTINGKKYYTLVIVDDSLGLVGQVLRSEVKNTNGCHQVSEANTSRSQQNLPRTPQQNGVVERQNRNLVEAARTMLIFSKAPMFLWAEAVATACYTQNYFLIHTRHDKTPYELVHNKKHDLTFFRVFGALCYPTNDSENLGKLQPRADIGIFIGYAPEQKCSGLVPNPAPAIPYVPPTNKELEMLFQPMFDEYFNPPDIRQDPIPNVAQDPVIPTGPSVSISFDLDAPSGSHISSPLDHHSSSVHHGVAGEQYAKVNIFVVADLEPFVNVFALDPTSKASSSGEIMLPEPNQPTQPHEHIQKWTDSHPLDNIIGNPSRPVSTRKQLATDALWCFYNSVLSKVEQKNFKSTATEDCWFQAMQKEIHKFDRLDVWELVPLQTVTMILLSSGFRRSTDVPPPGLSRISKGTINNGSLVPNERHGTNWHNEADHRRLQDTRRRYILQCSESLVISGLAGLQKKQTSTLHLIMASLTNRIPLYYNNKSAIASAAQRSSEKQVEKDPIHKPPTSALVDSVSMAIYFILRRCPENDFDFISKAWHEVYDSRRHS
ncbi:integrase, catalytic region, zinc finger, CCHC-type containing protein [Tanacetum coccineum]